MKFYLAMVMAHEVRDAHDRAAAQRTIGARLSSYITRKFGMTGLPPDHITIRLRPDGDAAAITAALRVVSSAENPGRAQLLLESIVAGFVTKEIWSVDGDTVLAKAAATFSRSGRSR